MGSIRQSLQAQPKNIKKSSKHQIYQSERKFSQKNYVSYLKSVKEPKIRIGATRRNLQAQPKMLKKKHHPNLEPRVTWLGFFRNFSPFEILNILF
jgi:hypothetical protein